MGNVNMVEKRMRSCREVGVPVCLQLCVLQRKNRFAKVYILTYFNLKVSVLMSLLTIFSLSYTASEPYIYFSTAATVC